MVLLLFSPLTFDVWNLKKRSEHGGCAHFVISNLGGEFPPLPQVTRGQEMLPWPELLKMGRKNLRCVEWAALSPEVLAQNGTAGFSLSRPTGKGELIDYFVSHSWSDKPARKWRAMQLVVDEFYKKNGRYPTFWIDKFCIDQNEPGWWQLKYFLFSPENWVSWSKLTI